MNDNSQVTTGPSRGRVELVERISVLIVGAVAIGAAVLRSLKPTYSGWFEPTRVDERVFVFLMVPLLWYMLRVAQSLKVNKDGIEFTRLQQAVAATKAATEETGRQVAEAKEQVAVTHAALAYGVGGGKHLRHVRAREHLSRDLRLPEGAGSNIRAEQESDEPSPTEGIGSTDGNSDPQKGRWGGLARRNGRELRATITPLPGADDLFRVRLEVVPVNNEPITGTVVFHLHPTFSRTDPAVTAEAGRATLTLAAWGAFTVGAEVDDGATQLELDLATIPGVPEVFARR